MKEEQRLFLVQARSAYGVFQKLFADKSLHPCHALHYLQMATELLGKAAAWKTGPVEKSHKALVPFLRSLTANTRARAILGYENQHENWSHRLRKLIPIADEVQKLAPALAEDGPNAEYPWPSKNAPPNQAPVEFEFPVWRKLTQSNGRVLLQFVRELFAEAEKFI